LFSQLSQAQPLGMLKTRDASGGPVICSGKLVAELLLNALARGNALSAARWMPLQQQLTNSMLLQSAHNTLLGANGEKYVRETMQLLQAVNLQPQQTQQQQPQPQAMQPSPAMPSPQPPPSAPPAGAGPGDAHSAHPAPFGNFHVVA